MKEITIENHVVPAASRSKNYYGGQGQTIIGGGTTIVQNNVTGGGTSGESEHTKEADHALKADEAEHALKADTATNAEHAGTTDRAVEAEHAGRADKATHADTATSADTAHTAEHLSPDSSDWEVIDAMVQNAYDFAGEQFLSKQHDDTAHGKITFEDFITLAAGMMLGNARIVKAIQSGQQITADDDAIVSAAKMLGTFLRKDTEDETKYLLRLTGGAIFAMLKTADYSAGGMMGAGLGLFQDETGKWCIETDKLYVRVKAIFEELEIRRLSVVNGNILLTPAGSIITSVADMGDYWRCTYKADDGTMATTNAWRVGDQARCQTFNIKPGVYQNVSNRYWWRLVVGCGDGYVDISKADADADSDTPAAGDVVIQLGHRTDAERQNAIMLSTIDVGAPSITQYAGINSYTLSGKCKTRISPNGNIFTGDFYLNDGRSVIQVIDGKITSVISETVRQQTDKDNYLTNGSFGESLDGWEYASGTRLFKAGGKYVKAVAAGQLSNKGTGAAWSVDDGHPVCYIGESQIKQLAANYASTPEIKTVDGKKYAVPIRVTLYYKVLADGKLSISFDGESKTGFADFSPLKYENTLTADGGYKMLETTGNWTATGNFVIAFSGKIYIHSVVLWLDEYTYYETRITQTATAIRLEALELSKRVDGIETRTGELEVTARNITARVSTTEDNITGLTKRVGQLEVTSEAITARVTATESNISGLTTRVGSLEVTATNITARVEANESDISGHAKRIGALEVRADAIELSVSETKDDVSAITTRVGTLEVRADGITQRVTDAESTIKGHTTRIGTLETTATNITARVSSVEDAAKANGENIVSLTERVGTLETTSSSVTARVSTLETTTTGNTQDIATLKVTANGLTSRVQKLAGNNLLSGIASGTGWVLTPRTYVSGYDSNNNPVYTPVATLSHYAAGEIYEFRIAGRYTTGASADSYSQEYSDATLLSPAVRVKTYTKYTLSFGLYLYGRTGLDWSDYKNGYSPSYVRSWLHILGGTSAAGAATGSEIINNWTYRLDRITEYDNGSYLRYKVTFYTSSYTYVRLKFWQRLFSVDGTNYGYTYIQNPQLELGENVSQFNAAETLAESWIEQTATSITAKLKDNTGIDIESGLVTVTANKFVVQTTSGKKSLVASDGKLNVDLLDAKTIVANGINAQTINAGSATFQNLNISGKSVFKGSIQNPFSVISSSSDIDYNDNVVVLSNGNNSWGYSYSLPWTIAQSGRLIRMVNYRWGYSTSTGYASISAPSGKYFFEDGKTKSVLKMSREVVELLGYGTASEFYGWIVIKRVDIDTAHKYGRYLRVLATGTVAKASGTNVTVSATTFDGSGLTGSYISTGKYKITIPTAWNVESGKLIVMATGYGDNDGEANGNALYAGVHIIEANTSGVVTSFTVQCGDDNTRNEGTVQFMLMNRDDWMYV